MTAPSAKRRWWPALLVDLASGAVWIIIATVLENLGVWAAVCTVLPAWGLGFTSNVLGDRSLLNRIVARQQAKYDQGRKPGSGRRLWRRPSRLTIGLVGTGVFALSASLVLMVGQVPSGKSLLLFAVGSVLIVWSVVRYGGHDCLPPLASE
jgi:hypothetical protein